MTHFKRILTWVLLIFVAAAVVITFRPRETVLLPDGLCVLFWHTETRCASCLKMEELLLEALHNDDGFRLFILEYDVLAHQSLARELNVGTTTIILVERKDQKNVRVRDLTAEIRKCVTDDAAFVEMLQKELAQFGKTAPS